MVVAVWLDIQKIDRWEFSNETPRDGPTINGISSRPWHFLSKMMNPETSRRRRTDADYRIDAFAKGIAVIEALEGTSFEPVRLERIVQRTGFSKDFVMRSLRTARELGWVTQNTAGEWSIGARFARLAHTAAQKSG